MSLEGEVEGHGMRPVKETTSAARAAPQSRRSRLPGMLPATPAYMREACGRRGRLSSGNRRPVATTFH